MTYYSDQIAASQKQIADALSGKRLRDSIRQLQERSKITSSLKPLQARGDLTAKKKVGKRSAETTGDYVERSRTFYGTPRELRSSDNIFVLQYYNVKYLIFDRGVFTFLDYNPDA